MLQTQLLSMLMVAVVVLKVILERQEVPVIKDKKVN
jgi:hypothetical protein